jgi:hypothetical protein
LAVDQVLKTFDYVRPHLEADQVGAYFFTEAVNDASKSLFQSLGFEVLTSPLCHARAWCAVLTDEFGATAV